MSHTFTNPSPPRLLRLPRRLARIALLLACLCLVAGGASAEQIINQSFAVNGTPEGWVVQGTGGTGHSDPGTALTTNHFYGGDAQNYLQLNSNLSYQRASAYYTGGTVNSRNFTLTANIYIGGRTNNADGLTFSFLNATPGGPLYNSNGSINEARLLGGYGEWAGSPQGKTSLSSGYVAGIQGFNFEFDHYLNTNEPTSEYTALVNVNNWQHYRTPGDGIPETTVRDFSSDPTFFDNTGWEQVQLRAWDGRMYFSYNYNGTTQAYDNSYSFTLPTAYTSYDAYFGITAGTGGQMANHWVRDVILENSGAVPEPGSLVLYGLLGLGLPWLRRRKRRAAAGA